MNSLISHHSRDIRIVFGYEARFAEDKVKVQIKVVFIDIFGNEKREVRRLEDFSAGAK